MDEKSSDESHKEVTTRRKTARNVRRTAQPAQQREGPRATGAKRDAQQASAAGPKTTCTISILRGSQNIPPVDPLQTSACLKHCNFITTDRMGTRDGPTAVHMKPFSTSVFNNSNRDVSSSFRATQILRQGPVHPTWMERPCLLGSTNSCPTNQD